ncbi:uncharacterized protein LOC115221533 [Argonauta hians]
MSTGVKPSVLICLKSLNNRKFQTDLVKQYLSRMNSCFKVVFLDDIEQNENLKKEITGAITPGGDHQATNKLLTSLPNLRVISNHGMGVDHLDIKWAKENNIRVGNTKFVISESTANLAITLILLSTRNIIPSVQLAMGNEETRFDDPRILGSDIIDQTLGIIGMGDIGLKVALRAIPFGMKIIYHNRNRRSIQDEEKVKATFYPRLSDMLARSDIVVIACPCTEQTIHLISTEEFRLMKKTCILVNIARGKIVNTNALVHALQTNEIKSAALDVTDPEPLSRDHPLLSMPNVVITPHCGTFTFETRLKMCDLVIENMMRGLEGKTMPSEVIP